MQVDRLRKWIGVGLAPEASDIPRNNRLTDCPTFVNMHLDPLLLY